MHLSVSPVQERSAQLSVHSRLGNLVTSPFWASSSMMRLQRIQNSLSLPGMTPRRVCIVYGSNVLELSASGPPGVWKRRKKSDSIAKQRTGDSFGFVESHEKRRNVDQVAKGPARAGEG